MEETTDTGPGKKEESRTRGGRERKGTRGGRVPTRSKGQRPSFRFLQKVDKAASDALSSLAKKDQKEYKLLLLGAGESGKTTIHKQIQLIHGQGFAEEDRKDFRVKIWENLVDGMASLIDAQAIAGVTIRDQNCKDAASMVSHARHSGEKMGFNEKLADAINLLWASEDIQNIFEASASFNLGDSFVDFADSLTKYPEWGGPEWVPADLDILRCRVRTMGIVDKRYPVHGAFFRVVDVGGQRSERKKWLQLFNGVTGVLFVAAMSGYDQGLFEDQGANRLEESIVLWEKFINRREFKGSAIVLFLNKFDIFVEKYRHKEIPLVYNGKFAEVAGPPPKAEEDDDDCTQAKDWFKNTYASLLEDAHEKTLYMHVTSALDPSNMQEVISAVTFHVLKKTIESKGLA